MSNYLRGVLFAICLVIVPSGLFAQSDICSNLPTVGSPGTPAEVIVEQMRQRSAMQLSQEQQRVSWTSKLIPLKNNVSNSTLMALCIFHAEIVPQAALHLLSVRAPQELMSAIEDAVKRLDGVAEVDVKLVMEPPWTPDRMTEDARDQLGIF